ncbi:MAG TPA: hypothetical protein DCE55_10015 [Planctomycetaceae bacterium]|nr:hypothetical protein [Planctomycetaceae bacterium]
MALAKAARTENVAGSGTLSGRSARTEISSEIQKSRLAQIPPRHKIRSTGNSPLYRINIPTEIRLKHG